MIGDNKIDVEIEEYQFEKKVFNATLIAEKDLRLRVEPREKESNINNIVINAFALEKSRIEIKCKSDICSDSIPVFFYMPNDDLELKHSHLEGFIYAKEIKAKEKPPSTITHKKDIRDQIPQIIRDLFEMDGKGKGPGSSNGGNKELEIKAIREVSR